MAWTYFWAAGGGGAQTTYNQFDYNGCAVGCGPVAWAMLFGWGDRQAEVGGNAYWAPRNGLYRENGGRGANAVAPIAMDNGVRNIIRELNGQVGTFCWSGSGATPPWSMDGSWRYLSGRSYTQQVCHWNSIGWCEDGLRNRAIASIRDRRTPAIIGTGWLSHYPLAFGYAWQRRVIRRCFIFCWDDEVYDRCFYVNQGWGGAGNEWVQAETWFSGEIYP